MNETELEIRVARLEHNVRLLMASIIALLVVVVAQIVHGQEVPTPSEAVGWALSDVLSLPESERPFLRYVWIPPWGDERWPAAVNFAVNTAASHSSLLHLGQPIANGWMLRYDLRRLAPKAANFERLQVTWDDLAVDDPIFHVPQVNTKIRAAVLAPHLKQNQAAALSGLSFSGGAIYRADWLIAKMLTTLEGGRYYDFIQLDRKPKNKGNAQAEWLASLGVFEAQTRQLNADQRASMFRSQVTGKPRRLDIFHGLNRNQLVSITHDIADEDIDAGTHPLRNLIDFQDRAREVIVSKPNGLHAFALFDGQGNVQDSAPDNVVRDNTVPAPHTSRLQPALSCIRCHAQGDGWQPFTNDVQTILVSGLDVFSDLRLVKKIPREEIVDTLATLYGTMADTPDGPLGRGRRDYTAAVFKISGGQLVLKDKQTLIATISDLTSQIYAGYRYDMVTPERACMELGLRVEAGKGVVGLGELLGQPFVGQELDPIEGTLRAGISINRFDLEAVYADLALKAEKRRKSDP